MFEPIFNEFENGEILFREGKIIEHQNQIHISNLEKEHLIYRLIRGHSNS